MGGSTTDPLEWKFQGGGGVKTERPSVGGIWIFSGNTQFMGEHYFRMPTIQCLAKSLKKLISPLLCTCNLLPFGVVASTGNFFHRGSGQLSFIQGGSAWRFKPSPFNYMCINTNFYQNDTPFIYPEQNCTPFLYLKDKPVQ